MTEGTISSPISRRSSALSIRGILVVALFATLWLGLWWQLSGEWSVNDQYSYGWFVPFFAVVLFWLRVEDRPGAESSYRLSVNSSSAEPNNRERITDNAKARLTAVAIMITALLLLFPIRLFEIGNPDWRPLDWLHAFCVVTITLVFLWSVGGKRWLR